LRPKRPHTANNIRRRKGAAPFDAFGASNNDNNIDDNTNILTDNSINNDGNDASGGAKRLTLTDARAFRSFLAAAHDVNDANAGVTHLATDARQFLPGWSARGGENKARTAEARRTHMRF
jgi:hypothetical protein